jgi:protease II
MKRYPFLSKISVLRMTIAKMKKAKFIIHEKKLRHTIEPVRNSSQPCLIYELSSETTAQEESSGVLDWTVVISRPTETRVLIKKDKHRYLITTCCVNPDERNVKKNYFLRLKN